MALFGTLFITINAITLLILFYNYYFKRRNLPPGPTPVPIFGNMLEILRNPSGEKKHLEWSRKYGPVYTFWMAENPVVCVANMDIMMNVFVKDADSCIDRYYNVGVDKVTKGAAAGLVFVDGELWKEQRRFALQVFRDFGVGKNVMQEKIIIELLSRMEKINDDLESDPDQEYDLLAVVDIAIGSIIAALMFGRRFDGDTTNRFYQLKNYTNGWLRATTHPGLHFYQSMSPLLAPIMIHIPLLGEPIRALRDLNDNIFEYLDEEIAEHAANADPSAPPTDYCEAYWREMQHRKLNDDNSKHHYFTMHQLRCACLDLWIAGQETTSNTIAWGLAYLLYNPHVTKKVCEELDTVIGSTERMITVSDRPKLHYMNALISEIQRVANLLPMNVLHKTGRDVTINGYFIPKGTTIIPQVSVPMCDDKVGTLMVLMVVIVCTRVHISVKAIFSDPDVFNPDRFIDPATGQFVPSRYLMPFSLGKRQCLGESLARMELFLFMANLLNQYTLVPASEMPSMKRIVSATVSCPPFRCRMRRREVDN